MKVIILYLGLLLIISSCGPFIFFEKPQPADSNMENIFPEALQGKYVDRYNSFSLNVNELTCEYIDIDSSSLFGNKKVGLSDSLILKKHNPYYILNLGKENLYHVFVISIKNIDTLVVNSIDGEDLEEVEKLKKITPVKERFNSNGNSHYYIINPTKKQFESMLQKNMFSGEMIFTRVNK